MFERFGNELYWLVNVTDYKLLGPSAIAWTHPSRYFKQDLHYLGAGAHDDRLNDHKMRVCHGRFYCYHVHQFNRSTKNKDELIKLIEKEYKETR